MRENNHEEAARRPHLSVIRTHRPRSIESPYAFRLLPPSSYGFRRMGRVLAVVAFLATIGYLAHDESKTVDGLVHIDVEIYMDQKQMCIEDHTSTPSQIDACIAEADRTYHETAKSHFLSSKTWPVILETCGILTIFGLFWSFVTVLVVRTIGYIALGFSKPIQS